MKLRPQPTTSFFFFFSSFSLYLSLSVSPFCFCVNKLKGKGGALQIGLWGWDSGKNWSVSKEDNNVEIVKLSKEDGMESLLHFSKTDNFGGKVAFVAANQLFAVSVLRPHSLSLVSLCCMSLSLSLSLKIHGKWKQLRSPPSVRSLLFLNALFSFSPMDFDFFPPHVYLGWIQSPNLP